MSLIAKDIDLWLGRSQILHDVALRAAAGQFTAIIGPNGSGKTTLLRTLTGELAPRSGTVMLNGADVPTSPAHVLAALRSVLPQQSALSFPFTASEIVAIGLSTRPVTGAERAALIAAALCRVGLPGRGAQMYQQMSGGEQQRVQLARALVQVWQPVTDRGPCWLFLDEPVSSLDIAHQLTVMRLAADYARSGGGVLAVMHDLNLTAMFADQVVLMHQGRVIAHGAPRDVITDTHLSHAYGCDLQVNTAPQNGVWMLPQAAGLSTFLA